MAVSYPIDELREAVTSSPQWTNLWTFTFDGNSKFEKQMQFSVTDVSMPDMFPELSMETLANGVPYYSKIARARNMTVTYRENVDFDAFNFFMSWYNEIYNERLGCFNSGNHTKDAYLVFKKYKKEGDEVSIATSKAFNLNGLVLKSLKPKSSQLAYNESAGMFMWTASMNVGYVTLG